jgi:hypothetical protein
MSKIAFESNVSGTGTFTIASPATNTNRTLTLPDVTGTVLSTADLASQAQAEAGTDNITLMTPLRTEQHTLANDIGWDQTFNVGLTRVAGTNYQNTTGRPITVLINAYKASTGGSFFISADNVTYTAVVGITTLTAVPAITVIIPNLYYYSIESGTTINSWRELR